MKSPSPNNNGQTCHYAYLHFPRPDLSGLKMNGPNCQYVFKMFLYLNMPTLNHYLISKRKHVNALNNCLINKSTKKADPKNENIHCDKSFVITFHEINASLTRVGPPVHTGKAKDVTPSSILCFSKSPR